MNVGDTIECPRCGQPVTITMVCRPYRYRRDGELRQRCYVRRHDDPTRPARAPGCDVSAIEWMNGKLVKRWTYGPAN